MLILGLNAYHGDSAACLVRDGELIAAVEEERFRRIKHWAGFPEQAINYCLKEGGVSICDLDYVAVNRRPLANVGRKILFALTQKPGFAIIEDRLKNALCVKGLGDTFESAFDHKPKIVYVEHHLAHLASSFFLSGMKRAVLCSVDGFGDFVSTMTGIGEGNRITVLRRIYFPHSLGLYYLAVTQYLGFPKYGDEYKVMGLSSYGKLAFMEEMRRMVRLSGNGGFRLGLKYFSHHTKGATMSWKGGEPFMGNVYSEEMVKLLGPAREKDGPVTERHEDIAASLQAMYEEAFFSLLTHLERVTGEKNLCLAGGCAMNSVANGKIFEKTGFKDIFIQPAAGDAGGAVGAAYYLYNAVLKEERRGRLQRAYLGPSYTQEEIARAMAESQDLKEGVTSGKFSLYPAEDEKDLIVKTVDAIIAGKVVGWFQGRMEWGPRALGNRSIFVDPRKKEMKDILNARIKRREHFRPFAPVILREAVFEYFETDYEVPFMLMVFKLRPEKRDILPAVTHVDGTGRLQTVTEEENPITYSLIKIFAQKTGVPLLLNTSFNENEPVVNSPKEALDCFMRTSMDFLALGRAIIVRNG